MVNKSVTISDELVGITDAQLQKRLKDEFNFACGPITSTTKEIYIKKLQQLIDNSKSTKSTTLPTTSISGRSTPVKSVTPPSTPKTRRKTVANPVIEVEEESMVPPKSTRRTSVGRSPTRGRGKSIASTKSEIKTQITNFSDTETEDNVNDKPNASINGMLVNDYSRGNRLLRKSYTNRMSSGTTGTTTRSSTAMATSTTKDEKKGFLNDNDSYSSDDSDKRSGGIGYSTTKANSMISPRAFRLFNRSSSLSNYSDSENEETNNLTEKKESNSITKVITKRLLRHRPKPDTNSDSKTSNKKDKYIPSKYVKNNQVVTQASAAEVNQLTADSIISQSNWISYGILIAGILFFAFIFSFYFYSRYFSAAVSSFEESELNALEREFDISVHELTVPGCLKNESSGICSSTQILPVLLIVKEIKKIVDKKLVHHYCSPAAESNDNPYEYNIKSLKTQIEMSIGKNVVELARQIRPDKTKAANPQDIFLSLFANALDLLKHNSKWFMRPTGENGEFEKIVIDPNYPKTLHSTCRLKLFMIKTFWYFVTLVTVSVIGCLVYVYVNHIKNQTVKEKELMYELVEKSIELLQSPDEPQSLPILHIRDSLLNPQQRKQPFYQRIWEQVVNFIENNESRVKSSLENIDGEDYKTWKWVATNTNQSESTNLKNNQLDHTAISEDNTTIQLPSKAASDEKASRSINTSTPIKNNITNAIGNSQLKEFVALTRFLKVRNMNSTETIESSTDWQKVIQNEILRRCCEQLKDRKTHGIQHIHVDERNPYDGLVYIKCESIEAASNAFKALHNMPFDEYDNKLISVKFLKEERYYHRFPDAINLNKALPVEF